VTDPTNLNKYKSFTDGVYGEVSLQFVITMIQDERMRLVETDRFIDLGSGVGQVVLAMAALSPCALSVGVEKSPIPSAYARVSDLW